MPGENPDNYCKVLPDGGEYQMRRVCRGTEHKNCNICEHREDCFKRRNLEVNK
jgi:hypothetical protein